MSVFLWLFLFGPINKMGLLTLAHTLHLSYNLFKIKLRIQVKMKSNLKFLLALGDTKLIMLNTAGENVFYFSQNNTGYTKDLSKIATLLQTR